MPRAYIRITNVLVLHPSISSFITHCHILTLRDPYPLEDHLYQDTLHPTPPLKYTYTNAEACQQPQKRKENRRLPLYVRECLKAFLNHSSCPSVRMFFTRSAMGLKWCSHQNDNHMTQLWATTTQTQRYQFVRLRQSHSLLFKGHIPFRVFRRAVASQVAAGDSTALDIDTHPPYHCLPSED